MHETFDVVVVGAGFAGVAAARDLAKDGYSVLALEARDRIGGRTYSEERMGRIVELGGTYVHWSHAHVWREMNRHGVGFSAPLAVQRVYWFADGELHSGTPEEHDALLGPLMDRLCEDALEAFPQSWDPSLADFSGIDGESISARIERMGLTQTERDILLGGLSGLIGSEPDQQAITAMFIWMSNYFGSWRATLEAGGVYRMAGGTAKLLDAIAGDSDAEFRLSMPVASISDKGQEVIVTTRAGDTVAAKAVVVAVPVNALSDIAITPPVGPLVQRLIDEGHTMKSLKVVARAKGELEPFYAFAPIGANPFGFSMAEYWQDGDTFLTCFGVDATALDGDDTDAVERALRAFVPDIQLVASTWHDWASDEFSRGTWVMPRPGQMSECAPEMRKPHGRIRFVGGDISANFAGSIEGALQSGTHVAGEVHRALKQERALSSAGSV